MCGGQGHATYTCTTSCWMQRVGFGRGPVVGRAKKTPRLSGEAAQ